MNLIDMFDEGLENSRNSKAMAEAKRGLYYNVNKRKKAGISRDKDNPKAPTDQAWKDAAKTAKKEDVSEGAPELLKAEMPLVRHIEQELADKGWQKSDDGYDKVFSSTMAMYRKFGNVDAIKKQGVAEGNVWHGTLSGSDEAEHTDHSFEEATQYIKGAYPFHKTYNVYRAEAGFRALFNPKHFLKGLAHTEKVDSGLDQLQLKRNPMMSGSVQVSPSIGYSWSVLENASTGIALLYYQDRGMGNDQVTIAAKDKQQLAGALGLFRDAGVIPDPSEMAARKAEKAAGRTAILQKKGLAVGVKFSERPDDHDNVYKITAIAPSGKVKAVHLKTGQTRLWSPGSISKGMLITGLDNHKPDVAEGWSEKYKRSINCSHPKGFSQKAHCAGKKKHNESVEMEMTCPDCGMCQTHGDHMMEVKQRLDAKCWKGKHKEGTKIKGGVRVNNCVPNESMQESTQGDPASVPIGQRMANDGITYSREREDEIIKLMIKYMKDAGFNSKLIRNLMYYDQDYVADQLDYLPREQGMAESNVFTDARMNAIKAGKDTFEVDGEQYKVTGDISDELEASGQVTESPGVRLKDLANVTTNMPDADFWLIRKGSDKTVGKPTKEFEPGRIGVKVHRTDLLDPAYLYYVIMHLHNQGYFASRARGITNLVNIQVSDVADIPFGSQGVSENFADGRNPQDKGDSKRYNVPTKASVSTLRKVAKQGGRKGQLAHWMANMKAGRAKSRAASEGKNLNMSNHMIKEQPADALSNLESILGNVRRITGQYRRADMHLDIIMQVEKLALSAGINPAELKYYIDDVLEKQRELEHAINSLDEPFEYAVTKLADQNDGLSESQTNKKKEIDEAEGKKRKFEYPPIEQSFIKDPEEYARWRDLREIDFVFGPLQRNRAMAMNGMLKKSIATPRQWALLAKYTDEDGRIKPRTSDDFVGEELTGVTAIDNDIKSIDQGVEEASAKPIFKGHYVYNVTPADVQDAQAIGLKQARDGHWVIAVYNTSGTKTVLKKQSADRAFGTGKWIAASVMKENKQTAVGLNENRVYYHTVGTSEKQLRNDFQLQQDEYGWYLSEDASPSLKLEALRTFGQPTSVNFMVEYDLAAFSGSTQTLGPDNVVSPVGSLPKTQKKKGK